MSYDIFTDSTSDLPKSLRDEYNILYTPMYVNIDGEEKIADLDWNEFSAVQFYNWMREGKKTSTAQVNEKTYLEYFTKSLEAGKDVLYLACSSGLSGSINIANVVKDELLEKYPDRKIICVDTLRATLGEGLIAIKSSELRKEGYSIEENAKWIEEHRLNFHETCCVETLTYLKNAGRVKAKAAFFGNLLGVKPMIIADALGNNYALKKVKGRRASLLEIINMMCERIVDPQNQMICIEHADCDVDCEFVRQHIIDKFNPKSVFVGYVGPIIGSTIGPGSIVVSYYGVEETIKSEQ